MPYEAARAVLMGLVNSKAMYTVRFKQVVRAGHFSYKDNS